MNAFHRKFVELCKTARFKQYPADQIIIYPGDPTRDAYIIKSGYVKVYDIDDEGNEKILSILKPGHIMPFAFYSGLEVHNKWFYQAISDTSLCVMTREDLIHELKADPDVLLSLINEFSIEVHELLTRISSLSKSNVYEKVLALMRYLAFSICDEEDKRWVTVPFPVSQQLLADMTGMTRESCSVAMKELAANNLVRSPKTNTLKINAAKIKEV